MICVCRLHGRYKHKSVVQVALVPLLDLLPEFEVALVIAEGASWQHLLVRA